MLNDSCRVSRSDFSVTSLLTCPSLNPNQRDETVYRTWPRLADLVVCFFVFLGVIWRGVRHINW